SRLIFDPLRREAATRRLCGAERETARVRKLEEVLRDVELSRSAPQSLRVAASRVFGICAGTVAALTLPAPGSERRTSHLASTNPPGRQRRGRCPRRQFERR